MDIKTVTNEALRTGSIDWDYADRQKMLRAVPKFRVHKEVLLAPGMSARGVCGVDVAAMDRRSVHAHLCGRGDLRVLWWNVFRNLHALFGRGKTLEHAMYSFHSMHHAWTFYWLETKQEILKKAEEIRSNGLLKVLS